VRLENIGINLDPALEPVLGQQKVKDHRTSHPKISSGKDLSKVSFQIQLLPVSQVAAKPLRLGKALSKIKLFKLQTAGGFH